MLTSGKIPSRGAAAGTSLGSASCAAGQPAAEGFLAGLAGILGCLKEGHSGGGSTLCSHNWVKTSDTCVENGVRMNRYKSDSPQPCVTSYHCGSPHAKIEKLTTLAPG